MIYILSIFTLILVVITFFLLLQNNKIRVKHKVTLQKLEGLIEALQQQQIFLTERVSINSEYNTNYLLKAKKLSEEIVHLQKVFLEVISNK
jgi:predicted Holliday junction resolvase-like endonuclease